MQATIARLLLLAFAFTATGANPPEPATIQSERANLQGKWEVVSWERPGISRIIGPPRVGSQFEFFADGTSQVTLSNGAVNPRRKYTLNVDASPKQMHWSVTLNLARGTLTLEGEKHISPVTLEGEKHIYRIEGDELLICKGLLSFEPRPKAVDSKPDYEIFVLKRIKPDRTPNNSSEGLHMKTLVKRIVQTTRGDVTLTVTMSDVVSLLGKERISGRFFELHVVTSGDMKTNDRVVWREFQEHTFPNPQAKWFCDAILDPTTDKIFLCLGTEDSITFGLYIVRTNAKPTLEAIPKLPLSSEKSAELYPRRLSNKRDYDLVFPPLSIYSDIPGIHDLGLGKEGDDLRVIVTVSTDKPPLILHYSLTKQQWTSDKK